MWKDFFYFSKGQRIGIVVLVVLILLVLAVNFTLPLFFPTEMKTDNSFMTEVDAFKKTLVLRDSMYKAKRKSECEQRYYKKYTSYPEQQKRASYSLFPFDPNTVDSATFIRLGIKPFIVSTVLKYRSKGGKFRTPTHFAKVYGILPEKFKELEPYISIQEIKSKVVDVKEKATKQNIIVELNTADTAQLMQVKGIGRGYAKGIVRFRRETGGFVSVEQLREIYGMRPENFERIRPFCTVNPELVQKINVNIATVQRLAAHPYLNFYQAKAIYELRRKKGKIYSVNELKSLDGFTPENTVKIQPYLSFE